MVDKDLEKAGRMVAVDGSNDMQEPTSNLLALCPEPRLLFNSRVGHESENAEEIYRQCDKADEYLKEHGCKSVGLMGDNCSTMKKVGRIWRENKKTGLNITV